MPRCRCAVWVCVSLLGLLAGCEVIDVRSWAAARPLPAFADDLEHSAWRFRGEWTPLVELANYPRSASEPMTRWTHPAVTTTRTAWMPANDATRIDEWHDILGDDFYGWNAAIVLGQRGEHSPQIERLLKRLVESDLKYTPAGRTESQVVPRSLRAAAAEAWCLSLLNQQGDAEQVFAPVGLVLEDRQLPDEIRAELIRGAGRRVAPKRIPGVTAALAGSSSAPARGPSLLRRAAMDACVTYAVHQPPAEGLPAWWPSTAGESEIDWPTVNADGSPLPGDVWHLQNDADPYLRSRYGTLLTVLKHPQAFEVLRRQTSDSDANVARHALICLGLLGSPEARSTLQEHVARVSAMTASGVVAGLSFFGVDALSPLATNPAAPMRKELAYRLARFPGDTGLEIARKLVGDAQLDVQTAAVASLALWPAPQDSRGLLLAVSESPTLKTRQAALRELEARHGIVAFPLDGDPSTRALFASRLAQEWGVPMVASSAASGSEETSQRWASLRKAEIAERLAAWSQSPESAVLHAQWFERLSRGDAPLVEELLATAAPDQATLLRKTVLPTLDPAYAAIENLELVHPLVERQQAARELQRLAERGPWPATVLLRLQTLLPREPDLNVWRAILTGLQRDQRPEAAAIARLALHGAWPDVRVLGCQYIAHHGQPDQATWLSPLFTDSNASVQSAAIVAAGRCRNPVVLDAWTPAAGAAPLPGLRNLLADARGELRLTLTTAMSRLGDEAAQRELTRGLHGPQASERLSAALAMSETGQAPFIEPLIRAVWTEADPQVRSAELTALKRLVPRDQHPPGLEQATTPAAAAEVWNAWRSRGSR